MNRWNDYLERFLTSRRAKGLAPRTVTFYSNNLTLYLKWLAKRQRKRVDDADAIELYMVEQRQMGLKDNTIHGRYRALKTWFTWLRRRRLIRESPMDAIDAPRIDQAPIQHMTLNEYQQLQGCVTGSNWLDKRDRCLLYVLFWCGLRVSEACGLRHTDVDPGERMLRIRRGKGGNGRFVPCGDDFGALVLDYMWSRPQSDHEWLFVGSRSGHVRGQLTPSGVAIMLRRRCAEAGLRHISPHKGRHGLAMELLNAGMEMSAVAKVLGHASQKTTADRYAKWLTAPLAATYTEVRNRILAAKNDATIESK